MANHLVSIGISNYLDDGIPNLRFCHKDAQQIHDLFAATVGDAGYVRLLVNNEATLAGIQDALGAGLVAAVQASDTLYVYFSGHGSVGPAAQGATHTSYMLPFDSTLDFANTAIDVQDLRVRLDRIRCSTKMLIVDCCFSGAAGVKSPPLGLLKSVEGVKTLQETVAGEGSVVFTACRHDETAIEDPEFARGLFTHFFIEELVRERPEGRIDVLSVHTPVTQEVTRRANDKYGLVQTPTFSGNVVGQLYLPVFHPPIQVTPATALGSAVGPTASSRPFQLDLDWSAFSEDVRRLVELVSDNRESSAAWRSHMLDEQFGRSMDAIRASYDAQVPLIGHDPSKVADGLAQLEADAHGLVLLSAVLGTFGTQADMTLLATNLSVLRDWVEHSGSGFVKALHLPQVLLAEAVYVVAVAAIAYDRVQLLSPLLSATVFDTDALAYVPFREFVREAHYCDSLQANAHETGDRLRSYLDSSGWLSEVCPRTRGRLTDLQLQANFLFCAYFYGQKREIFADYGRFHGTRIASLVARLRDDQEYSKVVAELVGKEPDQMPQFLREYMDAASRQSQKFWWNSVTSAFMDGNRMFL